MPQSRLAKPNAQADSLRVFLLDQNAISPDLAWSPLGGGRTNAIWKLGDEAGAIVCKLFQPDAGTPLFPNDPTAEFEALQALTGTGLGPTPRALLKTPLGTVLLYDFVAGDPKQVTVPAALETLARLHATTPPVGLREIPDGSDAILAQGDAMLADLPSRDAARLRKARPEPTAQAPARKVFLHGDAVLANMIASDDGVVLIDWQCPAIGDPCEDIACVLSPAMQSLYGAGTHSPAYQDQALAAYPDPEIRARYKNLAPAFHWRMAVYCTWKSARGAEDYAAASKLELARLEQ